MPTEKSPFFKSLCVVFSMLSLAACATPTASPVSDHEESNPDHDLGLQWVKHAAEYQAVSAQAYGIATRDLPRLVGDASWSAMPGQGDVSNLPPAVILDVDETVVSNIDFQLTYERPFANHKLDTWSSHHDALPVRGVQEFLATAHDLGVAVFFVTNRPCQAKSGTNDPCPQKQTVIDDIRELGIEVDAEHVMLSGERPEWDREKVVRREFIANTHRVVMLLGDDLSDFIACVRKKVLAPCSAPGTRASRAAALERYKDLWGAGWYILPNPMHGSWTSAR